MIFITGGARSGKSALAEKFARERGGAVTYIATARPGDDEMRERIAEHRRRRPEDWETIEAPADLPAAVAAALASSGTVLVDCLTVYISNLLLTRGLYAGDGLGHRIDSELSALVELCGQENPGAVGDAADAGRCIIVSNEVGMGIVPENRLARVFRDMAGRANQSLAAAADEVYLCVSGIPLRVK